MEFMVLGFVVFLAGRYLYGRYQTKKEYEQKKNEVESRINVWLANTEPRHRYFKGYPPDWTERKMFVQKRDKYTCQVCGMSVILDTQAAIDTRNHASLARLQVHHKRPLSKGGDNSLDNLVSLCFDCHEDQHPHMLYPKLSYYKKKAKTARRPDRIAAWTRLAELQQERIDRAKNINMLK